MSMILDPYRFGAPLPPLVALDPIAFTDNFNDNVLSASWTANDYWRGTTGTGTTVAEANGRIEFVTPTTVTGAQVNGITQVAGNNCTDKDVFIRHLPSGPSSSTTYQNEFALFADADNGLFFEVKGYTTGFKIIQRVAGVNTTVYTRTASLLNGKYHWFRYRFDSATSAWWFYGKGNDVLPTPADPPATNEWEPLLILPSFAALNPASARIALAGGLSATNTAASYTFSWDGLNGATI